MRFKLLAVLTLLPVSLLAIPEAAAQSGWANEEQLEANRSRCKAWDLYESGLSARDPKLAVERFLAARDAWGREGRITLYSVERRRVGVAFRKRLVDPRVVNYEPGSRIADRFRQQLERLIKRLTPSAPLAAAELEREARNEVEPILNLLRRAGYARDRIEILERRRDRRLAALRATKPDPKEDKPESTKPGTETTDGGSDESKSKPDKAAKARREAAAKASREVATLRRRLLLETLRPLTKRGWSELGDGRLRAAEATLSSALAVVLELEDEVEGGFSAEAAPVVSKTWMLERHTEAMRTLADYTRDPSKTAAPLSSQTLEAALDAAEAAGARDWAARCQQQLAVELIVRHRAEPEDLRSRSLNPWLERLRDQPARATLRLAVKDPALAGLPEGPEPRRSLAIIVEARRDLARRRQGASRDDEERQDHLRRRVTLLTWLRTTAPARDQSRDQDQNRDAGPAESRTWSAIREAAAKTERALIEAIVRAPLELMRDRRIDDAGIAGYLARLGDLNRLLNGRQLARYRLAAGLAGLFASRDKVGLWLVDSALAVDPALADPLLPALPGWLAEELAERVREWQASGDR